MSDNWITIWDNTAEARYVYVSESITALTGWEPEDVIGKDGFDLFHPEDHANLHKVHLTNVYDEKMSSMVSYRYLTKNNSYIRLETIIHYCHDVIIGSNFLYDENSIEHKIRANTVDEVFVCKPDGRLEVAGLWNDKKNRAKPKLDKDKVWQGNRIILSQERRFCLILNRFADALNIVFASNMATELVSLDTQKAIGTSLFDYVKEKDAEYLDAQIDLAREQNMVVRLRFDWIMDHENNLSEPVEAIVSSTDDGIVMVTRLAPRVLVNIQQ
ncbi:hypothetical protein V8B55DRAFT_1541022 [Mucor lusitanicus]|uniref:PAS domain-containing protein n=2 Tax=Mucor circinelloides f. lusitanicus TaxID=29924 RepID=A0A162RHZ9_MUCCL|nr:hypothetical protein FB192DRAFT_1388201 [Mucor lusitanicus]OAD06129.1 hypothetical protein MUCCIDRAFT_155247 [Mucor lusitanicus CBS 277.49]